MRSGIVNLPLANVRLATPDDYRQWSKYRNTHLESSNDKGSTALFEEAFDTKDILRLVICNENKPEAFVSLMDEYDSHLHLSEIWRNRQWDGGAMAMPFMGIAPWNKDKSGKTIVSGYGRKCLEVALKIAQHNEADYVATTAMGQSYDFFKICGWCYQEQGTHGLYLFTKSAK
jgi:hypothetical protein